MWVLGLNVLSRGITDSAIASGAAAGLALGAWRVGDGLMPMAGLLMILLLGVVATWMAYLFSYAERFDGSAKEVLKFSFLLMVLHPVKAVIVLLSLLAGAALVVIGPIALSIIPALICWLCDVVISGVFSQHLREEDRQKLEEKRKAMEE
jgi:uncharacterized membrane protein YesL